MINEIIDAISFSLNATFGDGYEIYTERVVQGLKEPCFFVFCINSNSKLFMGRRYFNQNMFSIQYFPTSNEKDAECNGVLEKLFDCLEYINVQGDLIRGTKIQIELVDGILNFLINYDLFVYKPLETTKMGELQRNTTDVKG